MTTFLYVLFVGAITVFCLLKAYQASREAKARTLINSYEFKAEEGNYAIMKLENTTKFGVIKKTFTVPLHPGKPVVYDFPTSLETFYFEYASQAEATTAVKNRVKNAKENIALANSRAVFVKRFHNA